MVSEWFDSAPSSSSKPKAMSNYLGLAGISSMPAELTTEYNKLFELVGVEGMLIAFERWADAEDITELIQSLKDNLKENF